MKKFIKEFDAALLVMAIFLSFWIGTIIMSNAQAHDVTEVIEVVEVTEVDNKKIMRVPHNHESRCSTDIAENYIKILKEVRRSTGSGKVLTNMMDNAFRELVKACHYH